MAEGTELPAANDAEADEAKDDDAAEERVDEPNEADASDDAD